MNILEAVEEAKKGNTVVCNNTLEFKWEDDTLVAVGELIASTKMIPIDLVLSEHWEVKEELPQLLEKLVEEAKDLGHMVANLSHMAGHSCPMVYDDMDETKAHISELKEKILSLGR